MGEQQIQLTEEKLEYQDFLEMVRLSNKRGRYILCGFFISAILLNIIIRSVSGVITSLILWGCYELYLKYSNKKSFQSNKFYQKEKVTTITEDGIELTAMDDSFHSITRWDEFCKVKENKKMIYLMTSSNGAGHFFLKKEFTPEQLVQFNNLIKKMLDSKLFVKENPLKYMGIGMLIQAFFLGLAYIT